MNFLLCKQEACGIWLCFQHEIKFQEFWDSPHSKKNLFSFYLLTHQTIIFLKVNLIFFSAGVWGLNLLETDINLVKNLTTHPTAALCLFFLYAMKNLVSSCHVSISYVCHVFCGHKFIETGLWHKQEKEEEDVSISPTFLVFFSTILRSSMHMWMKWEVKTYF